MGKLEEHEESKSRLQYAEKKGFDNTLKPQNISKTDEVPEEWSPNG